MTLRLSDERLADFRIAIERGYGDHLAQLAPDVLHDLDLVKKELAGLKLDFEGSQRETTGFRKILAEKDKEIERLKLEIEAFKLTDNAWSEEIARLKEALIEIAKGQGAYSKDPLEHCGNCVEEMKQIAKEALAEGKEGLK